VRDEHPPSDLVAAEWMLPPVSSNAAEQNSRSRSSPSGSGGARQLRHSHSSFGAGRRQPPQVEHDDPSVTDARS
jgi:hypothetical protein